MAIMLVMEQFTDDDHIRMARAAAAVSLDELAECRPDPRSATWTERRRAAQHLSDALDVLDALACRVAPV